QVSVDGWFRMGDVRNFVLGVFPPGEYPPPFPTHAHGDLGGFAWVDDGQEILTDCGRSRYGADTISWRQKSALGHNVVLVNGLAPLCETLLPETLWWPR